MRKQKWRKSKNVLIGIWKKWMAKIQNQILNSCDLKNVWRNHSNTIELFNLIKNLKFYRASPSSFSPLSFFFFRRVIVVTVSFLFVCEFGNYLVLKMSCLCASSDNIYPFIPILSDTVNKLSVSLLNWSWDTRSLKMKLRTRNDYYAVCLVNNKL